MTAFTKTKLILIPAFAALIAVPFAPTFAEDAPQKQAEQAAADAAKSGEAVKAEAPKEAQTATVQDPEKMKAYERAAEKAQTALKAIGEDLKEESAKHFFMMYQNYNLIGTVRVVQKDVGNAINECGKNNPGMKTGLDDRYKAWDGAIEPVMKEAQANVDNMIIAQEYTDPAKIKKAFGALDEARAATNASIDKRPVTSEDACKHLLEKMDETQENLTSLLRETLVSYGRVNQDMPPPAAPDELVPEHVKDAQEKSSAEKLKL
jgi:hypothetical protein